ncbi:hypothetical protein J0H33_03555 [bacterium]|nr:hypothetical protein [bacterium]
MQDRPTATELLEAIEEFLRDRSTNEKDRYYKFQFLVAANSLAVLRREWELEEGHLYSEWIRLNELLLDSPEMPPDTASIRQELLARNERLCDLINAGAFDDPGAERALLEHLIATARDELRIASPQQADEPA